MGLFIEQTNSASIQLPTTSSYYAVGFDERGGLFAISGSGSTVYYAELVVNNSTSSFAISASLLITSSYWTGSHAPTASYAITGSTVLSGSFAFSATTASYASTSNFVPSASRVLPNKAEYYDYSFAGSTPYAQKFGKLTTNLTASLTDNFYFPNTLDAVQNGGTGLLVVKGNKIYVKGYSAGAGYNYIFGAAPTSDGNTYANDWQEVKVEGAYPNRWLKVWNNSFNIFALGDNGKLYTMGDNTYGQLGMGNTTDTGVLKAISSQSYSRGILNIPDETLGGGFLKITDFYANNTQNTSTVGSDRASLLVCAEYSSSINLWNTGSVILGLGDNAYGQLGIGNTTAQTKLVALKNQAGTSQFFIGNMGNNIRTNAFLMQARSNPATGTTLIFAAGANDNNALGTQTTGTKTTWEYPYTDATYASGSVVLWTVTNDCNEIQTSRYYNGTTTYSFSAALSKPWTGFGTVPVTQKQVYACGDNTYYQLGDTTTTARKWIAVKKAGGGELRGVTRMQVSPLGIIALDEGGNLYATGYNSTGYWGDGSATNAQATTGARLIQTNIVDFFVIAGMANRSILITVNSTGQTLISGANAIGECGLGSTSSTITTAQVLTFPCGGYVTEAKLIGDFGFTDIDFRGTLVKTSKNKFYYAGHNRAANPLGLNIESYSSDSHVKTFCEVMMPLQ